MPYATLTSKLVIEQTLSNDVLLKLVLLENTEKAGTTLVGDQHWAHVTVPPSSCIPTFSMRLVGDALLPIVLQLQQLQRGKKAKRAPQVWLGQFEIPRTGDYRLEFAWLGCPGEDGAAKHVSTLQESIHLVATVASEATTQESQYQLERPTNAYLFSQSLWLSKNVMGPALSEKVVPDYIWADPNLKSWNSTDLLFLPGVDEGHEVAVTKSGTLTADKGYYKFAETGNYELVCFWGGPVMAKIRELFLAERKHIAPGQRPFKFHYYNVTNMIHPDADWTRDDKERCRKCKHIFLSLDDVNTQISQVEFESQFTSFVGHLQKLMNDTTFPIWILTFNSPPSAETTSHCHDPFKYQRTTDHPCNDVLRQVVVKSSPRVFEPRVHLLDNADIILPVTPSAMEGALANIAMRIFVAVGKGVHDWRAMGQHGLSDGLHKNDTVEPNFELIPYEGWAVTSTPP